MNPTPAPTPQPTLTPTHRPTSHPTPRPTFVPSPAPTPQPTKLPLPAPTRSPTKLPVPAPTSAPTHLPVPAPTRRPTELPIPAPSPAPSRQPIPAPTPAPSKLPIPAPSPAPTHLPIPAPTHTPTKLPVPAPTPNPSQVGCKALRLVLQTSLPTHTAQAAHNVFVPVVTSLAWPALSRSFSPRTSFPCLRPRPCRQSSPSQRQALCPRCPPFLPRRRIPPSSRYRSPRMHQPSSPSQLRRRDPRSSLSPRRHHTPRRFPRLHPRLVPRLTHLSYRPSARRPTLLRSPQPRSPHCTPREPRRPSPRPSSASWTQAATATTRRDSSPRHAWTSACRAGRLTPRASLRGRA